MSTIVTHGAPGGVVSTAVAVTVTPSATENIDSVPVSVAQAVKWFVTVNDTTNNLVAAFEVYAMHRNGVSTDFNSTSIVGDHTLSYVDDVVISGSDLVLQITNNEAVDLLVNATRLIVRV